MAAAFTSRFSLCPPSGILRLLTLAIFVLVFLSLPAGAATLTIVSNTPVPGPDDLYNFGGAARDGANVSDGFAYADCGANDAFLRMSPEIVRTRGKRSPLAAIQAVTKSMPYGRGMLATPTTPD